MFKYSKLVKTVNLFGIICSCIFSLSLTYLCHKQWVCEEFTFVLFFSLLAVKGWGRHMMGTLVLLVLWKHLVEGITILLVWLLEVFLLEILFICFGSDDDGHYSVVSLESCKHQDFFFSVA